MPFNLPDITTDSGDYLEESLDWVGMNNIALPIAILTDSRESFSVQAKVTACVNLSCFKSKGIHMSRLYLALNKISHSPLSPRDLYLMLKEFIDSHKKISNKAKIVLDFELMMLRPSLVSSNEGWKSYPCSIESILDKKKFTTRLKVSVPYSSTCPCSAALSRELIKNNFIDKFNNRDGYVDINEVSDWLGTTDGICATPHSQRSELMFDALLELGSDNFPLFFIINTIENALKTPVQTAVKREDELEFAKLNGQNLMFVEDAVRKVKKVFLAHKVFNEYKINVTHYESLHNHNAIAEAVVNNK